MGEAKRRRQTGKQGLPYDPPLLRKHQRPTPWSVPYEERTAFGKRPDLGRHLWSEGFRGDLVLMNVHFRYVHDRGTEREAFGSIYGDELRDTMALTVSTTQTLEEIANLSGTPCAVVGRLSKREVTGNSGEVYRIIVGRVQTAPDQPDMPVTPNREVIAAAVGRRGDLSTISGDAIARNIHRLHEADPNAVIAWTMEGYDDETRAPEDIPEVRDYLLDLAHRFASDPAHLPWLHIATRVLLSRCALHPDCRPWTSMALVHPSRAPWRLCDAKPRATT